MECFGTAEGRVSKNYVGSNRIEGMGHDPFEEDVDAFLKALENALEWNKFEHK